MFVCVFVCVYLFPLWVSFSVWFCMFLYVLPLDRIADVAIKRGGSRLQFARHCGGKVVRWWVRQSRNETPKAVASIC
jgi:hypothetical protein